MKTLGNYFLLLIADFVVHHVHILQLRLQRWWQKSSRAYVGIEIDVRQE